MTDASARIEELYAAHSQMVLGICRGLLRDRVEADDALQQTFLSAQRALANGSMPRSPESWLATIARNESLARVRARAARPLPVGEPPDSLAEPDAHAAAMRHEQVAGLRNALADLPAQQREAILLREVRGFSYDEVAASLSVTTAAVESLLFRARRRLQLTLREAVTALSPVGWLGPLRELVLRAGSGGFGSPDVAKVVAVGIGAAALAGGVVVTPQLVRHGVPARSQTAPAPARTAPAPSSPAQALPPQAQPPVSGSGIWFTGSSVPAALTTPHASADSGGDGAAEPAEGSVGGGSESESETPATSPSTSSASSSESEGESGATPSGATSTTAPTASSETESEGPTATAPVLTTPRASQSQGGAGDTTPAPQTASGGDSGSDGEGSSGGGSDGGGGGGD